MKTAKYWMRRRIETQQEHIELLQFLLDSETKMRKFWKNAYDELNEDKTINT